MTAKQSYDWQTAGGTNDVMSLDDCLEYADIARLVESQSHFWGMLGYELLRLIQKPT